ncbi:hypothetical protein QTO34_007040 [Cnephaeus nilssonii]|uniref:C2H2-type domain-containing protein n=1 Tax=Cnephaeus nilssonii TaxID=3371016 RepID=A0AA40HJI2_CNENI|nr:hypothetical protein QTO34_007040 [Eptesicus nilssonii]
MERSHINATYVREPSVISRVLKNMEEITMERKTCKCKECGKTIISSTSLQYMEAPTLERETLSIDGQPFELGVSNFAKTLSITRVVCHFEEKTNSKILVVNVSSSACSRLSGHLSSEMATRFSSIHERTHAAEKLMNVNNVVKPTYTAVLPTNQKLVTGEKRYECKQCGKTFSSHLGFQSHERTHTGEKPYECKQCGKTYREHSYLKTHKIIYTGEKTLRT